jgi:hypothetical protein
VRGAAFGVVEEALGDEALGILEAVLVIVGSIRIL